MQLIKVCIFYVEFPAIQTHGWLTPDQLVAMSLISWISLPLFNHHRKSKLLLCKSTT